MNFLRGAVASALLSRLGSCTNHQTVTHIGVPSTNNFILYEQAVDTGYSDSSTPLTVQSDVPLTIQRYEYDGSMVDHLLMEGEGIVLITSNCNTDGGTTVVPVVQVQKGAKGDTIVKIELGFSPDEAEQMKFLQPSSYDTTWYEGECWDFIGTQPTSGGNPGTAVEPTACLQEADCDEIRQKKGIATFRAGQFPTKGCFAKSGIAYWGSGGSVEEMSRENLPGIQDRVWCEKEVKVDLSGDGGGNPSTEGPKEEVACITQESCDQKRSDMGISTFRTGEFPTKGCFVKSGIAYWSNGGTVAEMSKSELPGIQERLWCDTSVTKAEEMNDVACLTEEDCDQQRQKKGLENFYSGSFPTKGCFRKNGKAYFSLGNVVDMSDTTLPPQQERIWCTDKRNSGISSVLQQTNSNTINHESVASSATRSASLTRSLMLGSLLHHSVCAKAGIVPVSQPRSLTECTYNVEIFLAGCSSMLDGTSANIQVNAPKARVIDSVMMNLETVELKNDPDAHWCIYCNKNTGILNFPEDKAEILDVSGEVYAVIQPNENSMCFMMVCGRPFMDSLGSGVLALPVTTRQCEGSQSWSTKSSVLGHSGKTSSEWQSLSTNNVTHENYDLGKEWTKSALGEHASVASFAAFSIALMTNRAPSHLVEDSLKAALDEVRHAKISFSIASELLGKDMGPGPLPPSSHKFDHNLTALALAVAKEGCVDETLSALAAAAEVELIDEVLEHGVAVDDSKYSGIASELLIKIRDDLKTISFDESNHSALAWRTLKWVCTVDANACDAANVDILNETKLEAAFWRRFSRGFERSPEVLERMLSAWTNIYTYQKRGNAKSDADEGRTDDKNPNASLISSLVDNISLG